MALLAYKLFGIPHSLPVGEGEGEGEGEGGGSYGEQMVSPADSCDVCWVSFYMSGDNQWGMLLFMNLSGFLTYSNSEATYAKVNINV
jgi:hypothetical protein